MKNVQFKELFACYVEEFINISLVKGFSTELEKGTSSTHVSSSTIIHAVSIINLKPCME